MYLHFCDGCESLHCYCAKKIPNYVIKQATTWSLDLVSDPNLMSRALIVIVLEVMMDHTDVTTVKK